MTQSWKVKQTIKEPQTCKATLILLECKIKYCAYYLEEEWDFVIALERKPEKPSATVSTSLRDPLFSSYKLQKRQFISAT